MMPSATSRPVPAPVSRRLPVGAEVTQHGVHFRVWAPKRERVSVVIEGGPGLGEHRLERDGNGYFGAFVQDAGAGTLYRFRLDGDSALYPDPASRFQPEGVSGPSEAIDPAYAWSDATRRGVTREGQVVYEMHVGTFTAEGTLNAAARELAELAALGVTVLEIMPVAEFPGRFGWGYDGVFLFAPTRLYGRPDDLRRFVDRAHAHGLGVILDVVYNHLGPHGNCLKQFADAYFTDRYETDWGEAINFDGEDAGPVREFFSSNAAYWIDEYHLDGLRFDATQSIYDRSDEHVLRAIARRAREAAGTRSIYLVAENETQDTALVRDPATGGYGLDAVWNDDFHHAAIVRLTGHRDAYYSDYRGAPQEFISAAKYGYLFQGQRYSWQKQRRGTAALDMPPSCFITFIENHDQVANSFQGDRVHRLTSPGRLRAMTALVLLAPGTPMLFQGQEFGSSRQFLYFADHTPELAAAVRSGRAEFLAQFSMLALPDVQSQLPDPADIETFLRSKVDFAERERHAEIYALHRDLLRLRREDAVFSHRRYRSCDGAVLTSDAFVLRYFGGDGDDRLLIVNFGCDVHLVPAPEPLLAPPVERSWELVWTSEAPRYGGLATPPVEAQGEWRLPAECAVVLRAGPEDADR